jgi:hypothetical protein
MFVESDIIILTSRQESDGFSRQESNGLVDAEDNVIAWWPGGIFIGWLSLFSNSICRWQHLDYLYILRNESGR